MTSQRRTLPNQRWNNGVYANMDYFNIDMNNIRKFQDNVPIFDVKF